jgi:hypothetical protein
MPTVQDHVDRGTPFGANVIPGGVTFRVFAPAARQMYVLTGAPLAASSAAGFVPSSSDELFNLGDNTWGAFVRGVGEGTPYRFWVVGKAGFGVKRDPRDRELGVDPPYPNCDCLVRSPVTIPWHDQDFVGLPLTTTSSISCTSARSIASMPRGRTSAASSVRFGVRSEKNPGPPAYAKSRDLK